MENFSLLHKTNITLHVVCGSLALIAGLIALVSIKSGKLHKSSGQIFLILMAIVILTGLVGVFFFGRNTFLLVITVLSGYMAFSGYRIIKLRSNVPKLLDISVCIIALTSVLYFLYYFKSIGLMWSPVIIYSTVGYIFLMVLYDIGKYLLPVKIYTKLWLPEHILKMVSAFSGLLSAFSGTVLPHYQPYSQFLPSILGTLVAIGFIISTGTQKGLGNTPGKTASVRKF